ncbi:MAG: hypothetical protein AB7F99_16925, partial [Vicinamibacterales bacterium]
IKQRIANALEDLGSKLKAFAKDPKKVGKKTIDELKQSAIKMANDMQKEFEEAGRSEKEAKVCALVIAGRLVSPVGTGTVLAPAVAGIPVAGIPLAIFMNTPLMGVLQAMGMKAGVKAVGRTRKAIKKLLKRRADAGERSEPMDASAYLQKVLELARLLGDDTGDHARALVQACMEEGAADLSEAIEVALELARKGEAIEFDDDDQIDFKAAEKLEDED